MGKIFYIIGKSSTGKDTIYKRILHDESLHLESVVLYTTRPIRDGEIPDVTYHYVDEDRFQTLKKEGKIIEDRAYNTVHGLWRYFTVNDEALDLKHKDYLIIGVLSSYLSIRDYFGADNVVPIYIEIEDGLRLQRALDREKKPENRRFTEMCRRFLSDTEDFSEDKLAAAGIERRFINDDLERCIEEIRTCIGGIQNGYKSQSGNL
ncbi:MAG: guanylate kinase [Lachnospiraceae bacterium]|nr:guanylate kinase [Lachnospiraceae bacterium]